MVPLAPLAPLVPSPPSFAFDAPPLLAPPMGRGPVIFLAVERMSTARAEAICGSGEIWFARVSF